jgi:hypothetical protein
LQAGGFKSRLNLIDKVLQRRDEKNEIQEKQIIQKLGPLFQKIRQKFLNLLRS